MASVEATYRTLEDIELRLLNGRVVYTPALSIAEAKRLLRSLTEIGENPAAHVEIIQTFPQRTGLTDERLVDLGFEVEGLEFGELTLGDALAMAEIYGTAAADAYAAESSRAKVRVLDEFPVTFGLDAERSTPAEVFGLARTFVETLYLLVYGLAQDFSRALTASPPVRALELRAPSQSATSRRRSAR